MKEQKTKKELSRKDFIKITSMASAFFIVPRFVLGRGYTAPSDKINIGFIGCGKQSPTLRNGFLKTGEVRMVGACDVFAAKTERFIQGVQKFYTEKNDNQNDKSCVGYKDFRELLNRKEIDAVIIAVPDHWHGVMAVKACEAGKDVYCEKPLSLTVAEGRAMVTAARKHNRVFQTGSMQRSWPEFRQAVELVRNGYIGEIKTVKVNIGGPPKEWDLPVEKTPDGLDWDFWLGPNTIARPYNNVVAPTIEQEAAIWPKWRDYKEFGGGAMTDWGAHMFDIAQWGLDMDESGPVKVIPPPGTANAGLVYHYANGIQLIHEPKTGKQACHFIGSKGEVWVARGELLTTPASLKDQLIGANEKRVYFSDNHYTDFIKAIRSRQKPICDVETGHRTASVCNLGNIAYSIRRPLEWDPVKERFINDPQADEMLSRTLRKKWRI
ncbi:MAG: Gfo/Idh/MocA family oxidoreductase [Ferruginibacter sp.]|nr:Gfo/Idh/MocA family oxidoreductase [Ferruginibacter sp.]